MARAPKVARLTRTWMLKGFRLKPKSPFLARGKTPTKAARA